MRKNPDAAVWFRKADNRRVGVRGAMGGWDQVRARLKGADDRPMLYLFSTCRDLIRTLPALQHDPNRPEDVDTEGEDHAADALRYACMSRPYILQDTKPPTEREVVAQLVAASQRRSLNDMYRQWLEERGELEDYDERNMPPLELN